MNSHEASSHLQAGMQALSVKEEHHHHQSGEEGNESYFCFPLEDFRSLEEEKLHSPWHYFGNYIWRLMVFPTGNHSNGHLSAYLQCGGPTEQTKTKGASSSSWRRPAYLGLEVLHPSCVLFKAATHGVPHHPGLNHRTCAELNTNDVPDEPLARKETSHVFRENADDWGFVEIAPLEAFEPGGYIDKNGSVVILVSIRLLEPLEYVESL